MSGNGNGKQELGSVYRVFRTAFAAAFEVRPNDAAPLFDAENEPNDELERVRRRVERWSVEEGRDFSTFRARKAAFGEASAALGEYLRDVGVDFETVEDESARFGWEALTAAGGSASQTLFLGRLETAALEFGRAFSFLTNEERAAARLASALAQAFLTESANAAASLRRIDAETFDASAPKSRFGAFWRLRTDARDALAALAGRPTTKEIWRRTGRYFWERAASEPNEATAETAFRLARATRAAENDDWTAAFDALERIKIGDDAELNDAVKALRAVGPGRGETTSAAAQGTQTSETLDGEEDAETAETAPSKTLEAGARRVVKVKGGVEIALRWIPAGEFELGSPADEPGRSVDEALHKATLTRGVWFAETETTQRLWTSVMGTNPSWFSATGGGKAEVAGLETDDFPVENVSWNDCREFLAKLNARGSAPGWRFRLPTEAEWERACRAGTTTRFYWGDDWNDGETNGRNASGERETTSRTRRVGGGEPNPWGLFDMSGNVAEWCEDYYCVDFHVENAVDPTGPSVGGKAGARVVRGGAFDRAENDSRSAKRFALGPSSRRRDVGFRLALAKEAGAAEEPSVETARTEETAPVKRETDAAATRLLLTTKKGVELAFRWIQAGTFWMGSPDDEPKRRGSETLRKTTLTRGFWMMETPITQRQWASEMGKNPSWFSATGGGKERVAGMATEEFPVENISWNDCQKLIQRLNAANIAGNDWVFRLPTEAEWEYACRAGTTTPFSFGAWCNGGLNCDCRTPYEGGSPGKFLERTCRIRRFKANAWGLFDMHGNVAEWCADRFGEIDTSKTVDPTGPAKGGNRVVRGGAWGYQPEFCRSAKRSQYNPAQASPNIGARLVLVPKRKKTSAT